VILDPAQEDGLRAALQWHGPGCGLGDVDSAAALIDRSLLVFDDQGRPMNVRQAIDELLERKPYLGTEHVLAERRAAATRAATAPRPFRLRLTALQERVTPYVRLRRGA
jgi:hypothetical protein